MPGRDHEYFLHLSPRIQLLKQKTTFYGEKERKKKKRGKKQNKKTPEHSAYELCWKKKRYIQHCVVTRDPIVFDKMSFYYMTTDDERSHLCFLLILTKDCAMSLKNPITGL